MVVTKKNIKHNGRKISTLSNGMCFKLADSQLDSIFLYVGNCTYYGENGTELFNVINLINDEKYNFEDNRMVYLVDAELTWELMEGV